MKRDVIVRAVFDAVVICVIAGVFRQYQWLPNALVAGLQTFLLCAVAVRSIAKWYGLGLPVLLHGDRAAHVKPDGEIVAPENWRVLRRTKGPALEDGVRADRTRP
jgi:hypothetical protein